MIKSAYILTFILVVNTAFEAHVEAKPSFVEIDKNDSHFIELKVDHAIDLEGGGTVYHVMDFGSTWGRVVYLSEEGKARNLHPHGQTPLFYLTRDEYINIWIITDAGYLRSLGLPADSRALLYDDKNTAWLFLKGRKQKITVRGNKIKVRQNIAPKSTQRDGKGTKRPFRSTKTDFNRHCSTRFR